MRRPLILLLLLAVALPALRTVRAQTVQTTIASATLCPGATATLPVTVTNFNDVGSISLTLLYDQSKVTYLGYQNAHPSLTSGLFLVNDLGGEIKIAWFSLTPVSLESDTMLEFLFSYQTGFARITWDTSSAGTCQYGNGTGATMNAWFTSGYIAANGSIINQPLNDTIVAGTTADFSVTTHGTTLGYRWQENTGQGWTDIFNGTFYSGANSSHLFVTTPPLSFDGYRFRCRTTGTCPAPGNVFFSNEALLSVLPPCQNAWAYAGVPDTICAGWSYPLQGQALFQQSVQWTGGDGIFVNDTALQTTYIPGLDDVSTGSVLLSLVAFAQPPCLNDTSSLLLTIDPCTPNNPPSFVSNGNPADTLFYTITFQQDTVLCLAWQDPDGDSVFLAGAPHLPLHGVLGSIQDGDSCVLYQPATLYLGPDQFTLRACDAHGACDTVVVRVQVVPPGVNMAPLALEGGLPVDTLHVAVQMNLQTSFCPDVFDPEGMACDILSITDSATYVTAGGSGMQDTCLFILPDTGFTGYDTLVFQLCDTAGACRDIVLAMWVVDLNIPYAPQANDDLFAGWEDQPLQCPVLLNDFDINMDIDTPGVQLLTFPVHGQAMADSASGVILYAPQAHFWGHDSLIYQVCDSSGLCDTATLRVRILSVYDPPSPDTFSLMEDQVVWLDILANDQYPFQQVDTSSLAVAVGPQHGTVTMNGAGMAVFTPGPDFYGVDSFSYHVCDSSGDCGLAAVRLEVLPVNDPPRILRVNGIPLTSLQQPAAVSCANLALGLCLGLADPEGDSVVVDTVWTGTGAAMVQWVAPDTCFQYQPSPGFSGLDSLFIRLHDGSDTALIPLRILVHAPPQVSAGGDTSVCAGTAFVPDAMASSVSAISWSGSGTGVFINPGTLHTTYVPSNQDLQNGSVILRLIGFGIGPCGADTSVLQLSFQSLPAPELGGDLTLCENYSKVLDGGAGFASWLWSTGNTGRYQTVDTNVVPAPGGVVSLTVTDANGCANDDQVYITFVPCPGLDEHIASIPFSLFPNPATDQLWVGAEIHRDDSFVIQIADMSGRIRQVIRMDERPPEGVFVLDVSKLEPGMYLLTGHGSRQSFHGRFVRMR